MRVNDLCAFIKEREKIRLAKEAGKPRDKWTKDPILATYRFCNVRRNDDRVTRELNASADIMEVRSHEDQWFWWVVARLFNKQQTMHAIDGYILPFKPEEMRKKLKKQRDKYAIFNGAYIVSTNGKAMDKVDYIIDLVLKPMWKDRKRLRPTKADSLDTWHRLLMTYDGMGSFMAAQVVADMKYVDGPLRSAPDWLWWAASGPGSRRGLARVMHDNVDHHYNETVWRFDFHGLWEAVNKKLKWAEPLTGQDLQNCLCEFDKYERARLGQGKPKQIYKEAK